MKNRITFIIIALAFVNAGFGQLIQIYSDVSVGGNNTWNLEQRWDFTYDQDGDTLTKNQFYYMNDSWEWTSTMLNTYTDGFLINSDTQTDFDGYAYKTEYVYNADGKIANTFFYTRDMLDENWTKRTWTHYSYVNGNTDQVLRKVWSEQYQAYLDSYKTVYSYPNATETTMTSYTKTAEPAPNDWAFDKQKITDTESDFIVHEQFYDFNQDSSAFLPESEIHYNYDANGVLDSVEYSVVGANGMEKIKVENYFYNPDASKDYTVIHKKVAGNWRYDHRLRYLYFSQLGLDEKEKKELIVYPNPVSDMVNFTFTDDVQSAGIYDLNGVLLINIGSPQLSPSADVSPLAAGMYTLRVFSLNGFCDQLFIKQ